MTRERAAELLSEVTVLDDPEMAEAYRVTISALRQQNQEQADVVQVTRCGGCKYGRKCGDEISCYHPEYALREGVWSYEEDFYCKYGEPKEGNGNG